MSVPYISSCCNITATSRLLPLHTIDIHTYPYIHTYIHTYPTMGKNHARNHAWICLFACLYSVAFRIAQVKESVGIKTFILYIFTFRILNRGDMSPPPSGGDAHAFFLLTLSLANELEHNFLCRRRRLGLRGDTENVLA